MNRNELRELYKKSGVSYTKIKHEDICTLVNYIENELNNSNNQFKMKLSKIRKKDITYNKDGSLEKCYLMVDSYYFKRREAISFNTKNKKGEEFIGFAGWASSENLEPFVNSFKNWILNIKNNENNS